jgi:hypothetical protein
MTTFGALMPTAAVKIHAAVKNPPHQHDDFSQGEFCHGTGITMGIVEHGDTLFGAMGAVNLLDSNAVRADRK